MAIDRQDSPYRVGNRYDVMLDPDDGGALIPASPPDPDELVVRSRQPDEPVIILANTCARHDADRSRGHHPLRSTSGPASTLCGPDGLEYRLRFDQREERVPLPPHRAGQPGPMRRLRA